ncbi:MAG: hypothetical protein V4621_06120 [Pseudomonadota bacterium]
MKYLIFTLALFMAFPSWAEDVTVDVQLCRDMVSHVPGNDVAYRPGVDVKGKPVIAADVQTSQDFNFLKTIQEIPLSVDLARRLNINTTGLEMETPLPPLHLRPDGRVFWNGQDLTQQSMHFCRNQGHAAPMVIRPDAITRERVAE